MARILLAEDDDDMRRFLVKALERAGYQVSYFDNGASAYERLREEPFSLLLTDIVMPEMDGITLLRSIKSNTNISDIPVILLTSKSDVQYRLEGMKKGADAYIDKPFNMEELEARIAGLIANRNRMKGKFSGVQEQDGIVRQIELKGNNEQLMEKIMEVVNARLTEENALVRTV